MEMEPDCPALFKKKKRNKVKNDFFSTESKEQQ
jgi:hypothetical protein